MIITTIVTVNEPPILSHQGQMIKLDFGGVILETSTLGFKCLIHSLVTQASEQAINLTIR